MRILNFFGNRLTNASAESFRATFRGVDDVKSSIVQSDDVILLIVKYPRIRTTPRFLITAKLCFY